MYNDYWGIKTISVASVLFILFPKLKIKIRMFNFQKNNKEPNHA